MAEFVTGRQNPAVLVDEVTTLNGTSIGGTAVAQRFAEVTVDNDGNAIDVGAGNPKFYADASPPLVQVSASGVTINAGEVGDALPATTGRVKALVQHCGSNGKLWIRFDGAAAAPGFGECAFPGQQWSEYTASAVSVYFEGTGSCVVATSELSA